MDARWDDHASTRVHRFSSHPIVGVAPLNSMLRRIDFPRVSPTGFAGEALSRSSIKWHAGCCKEGCAALGATVLLAPRRAGRRV
jgi:hypothetical protein